jgi:hypothetical protein
MAKRPIAVWITQILFAIMLVAFVGLTIYVCLQIVAAGMRPGIPRSANVLYGDKKLTRNCLFLFLFGLAFLGLCKAGSYGRWLGLAFVLLFWGTSLYTSIHPVKEPIPRFSIDYSNPSELAGAVLGAVLVHADFSSCARTSFLANRQALFPKRSGTLKL